MPSERHKLAANKHWIHRLLRLPLNENNKRKELNTTINITLDNGYKKDDIMNLHNRLKYRQRNQGNNTNTEQKWVTFTYTGNYIRKCTKLFKDTHLKIAFKTTTTADKLLDETRTMNTYEQRAYTKWLARAVMKYTLAKGPKLNKILRTHKKHKVQ
jgi:hypothetical protein